MSIWVLDLGGGVWLISAESLKIAVIEEGGFVVPC